MRFPSASLVKKRVLVPAILLVLTMAGVAWWLTTSPGDLSLLALYAERYNYEQLIRDLEAQNAAPDEFAFVVLGDTRNNMYVAPKVYQQAATEHPALILNTGDLIRGGTVEEYLNNHIPLLEIAAPVPVFCVPGNHDRGERRDFAAFKALYGNTRFSFDYGPCRFVGFNASEKIRVSSSELAFLDRELSKPGARHKFVFFHIPPKYFERVVASDDRRGFAWNAEELRAILARHEVTEVFMGHIHGYASTVIDGVRYTLTAGAGAPLSTRLPEEGRIYHYLLMRVAPSGLTQELVYMDRQTGEWRRRRIY